MHKGVECRWRDAPSPQPTIATTPVTRTCSQSNSTKQAIKADVKALAKEKTSERSSRSTVQSVRRASLLLRELAARPGGATAVELARLTGLDRTVIHRLLVSLSTDYLVENVGSRYYPGRASASLAAAHVQHTGLRQAALPYLVDLHRELEKTSWIVALGIPALGVAVLIERIWKPRAPLSTMNAVGTTLSLEGTALGRCLLAYADDDSWALYQPSPWLVGRLDHIRACGGIETSLGEIRPGSGAVASVILDAEGKPVGGVVVSGPAIDSELFTESSLAQRVSHTSQAIMRVVSRLD